MIFVGDQKMKTVQNNFDLIINIIVLFVGINIFIWNREDLEISEVKPITLPVFSNGDFINKNQTNIFAKKQIRASNLRELDLDPISVVGTVVGSQASFAILNIDGNQTILQEGDLLKEHWKLIEISNSGIVLAFQDKVINISRNQFDYVERRNPDLNNSTNVSRLAEIPTTRQLMIASSQRFDTAKTENFGSSIEPVFQHNDAASPFSDAITLRFNIEAN